MKNGLVIDKNGNKRWYRNGRLHRTDGPAVEWANGDKAWWVDGKCHRTDGPAIERINGDKIWYRNDKYHRTDGPAVEYTNGAKAWWMNDVYLGPGDEGFWALWDRLNDKQRSNLDLLMYMPRM